MERIEFGNDKLTLGINNLQGRSYVAQNTFNCDKERAYSIWKYITDNDNGVTNFHMEISSDLLRDKDIELF